MIGTSDRISLVNQIWPNKRRGWRKEEEEKEDEGNREARGLRAGGLARTVALRACISMREGCEKGGRSKEEEREERTRGKRNGREKVSTRCRSRRTRLAKRLARRDFSNFLCVLSSFPGYPDPENVGRLSVLLRVALQPIPRVSRNRRKCRSSFSPIVSNHVIERRENERTGNSEII